MPKKFDRDFRGRVVRLVEDRVSGEGVSVWMACVEIASRLGVSAHTAKSWVRSARREAKEALSASEEDLALENARLRRRARELEDTNDLLKAASAFFASELDPTTGLRVGRAV